MLKHLLFGFTASLSIALSAHAETVYVSDIQFVAIREGLSNSTRATERGIKSGTPLTVLERRDSYTKVRTPEGNVGWLPDYFVSEDRVSRDQLVYLENQLTQAKEANIAAQEALQTTKDTNDELIASVNELTTQKAALEQRLEDVSELAQKAKAIVSANESSDYKIKSLQQQVTNLTAQNDQLSSSTEQRWFMIGAGTLIIGGVFGLLFPMTRRKKAPTSSW
ncbi:TIGR04211 family SH3 domain-containing protein [Marinomonas piezotolerans]|uniref:TIGR04211 family SH3 domain-containing protein n=1 Tax=Marinomonas piezotolerans TaxID=2213058 RepID=A0A370UDJ5_9GAMM|nr:TIGR04211 family SH3 domain-containing protein [Marinomonas piezotolerans]RDL45862.1 TIGR04211 family SH3 domain-containing protein [Marinomonas piezotolerans]